MKPLEAIRCTLPSCPCECFSPSKTCLRTCETCKHGWVAHALDKLGYRHVFNVGLQVEIVQPNIVFDIASLMLYGAQATPIRLKILLDRLFSVLQHEEVLQVLHGFGWSYEDYARGYILQYEEEHADTDASSQETSGRVLGKWTCATREEEYIIIQQFLRFGETKSIAQEIILQDTRERQDLYIKQTSRNESEIKKFIERSNMSMQSLMRPFDVRHLFGARLPFVGSGSRLLSPPIPGFSTPSSSPRGELRPPLISVSSTSPVTTSPLGRLQTMQPFDYRRESTSPAAISPGEKKREIRENSPKSDSPQNLSLTSTSAHSTPPHTPYTPHKISDIESPISHLPMIPSSVSLGAATMILPLQRQHNDEDIINFSVKEDHELNSSVYMDRKNKHMRKSSNPIKRNWLPEANFGSTMIGPNGKKRVLCSACNKTFCDKGALKIHYSAVHLKEMHKCSVEGCTMMFSSRRSRNRHSANPNPKLHMPQKRPKIPEGATLIDNGSSPCQKRPLSTPPTMVLSPSLAARSPIGMMDGNDQRSFYTDPNMQMPMFPSASKRLKLESDEEGPKDLSLSVMKSDYGNLGNSPRNMSLPLQFDHENSTDHMDVDTPTKDSQDGSNSENEKHETSSSNNSPGPQRTQSRRKNIPTRCAPPMDRYKLREGHPEEGDGLGDCNQKGSLQQISAQVQGQCDSPSLRNENDEHVDDEKLVKQNGGELVDARRANADSEEYSMDKSDDKLVIDDDDDEEDDDDEDIDKNDTGEILDFSMNALDAPECESMSVMSGQDSNTSFGSNDSLDMSKNNGEFSPSDYDIPIDKENPKQCITCGKQFLNIFGLKIHYKNVHLKLMHTCTVEGCSAAFPSKRSRDRHSSNLNLHRKLLSTSDDHKNDETDDNQNFRADVIQKLYECQNFNDNGEMNDSVVNGNSKHDSAGSDDENDADSGDDRDVEKTNGIDSSENGELGIVTSDGMVTCHICDAKVRDNLVLKEHFEMNHPKEMFHCTIKGCEKIFSTRKSRNRHSQNDSLHKSLSPNGRAIAT